MALPERIIDKIDASGDCREWTGCRVAGYGRIRIGGRTLRAHRVVWESLVGPIPARKTLDHLCRNTRCVNPDHLEVVTLRENILRGEAPAARLFRQMRCAVGHPFDVGPNGRRFCRRCRDKRRHQQRKGFALERSGS